VSGPIKPTFWCSLDAFVRTQTCGSQENKHDDDIADDSVIIVIILCVFLHRHVSFQTTDDRAGIGLAWRERICNYKWSCAFTTV